MASCGGRAEFGGRTYTASRPVPPLADTSAGLARTTRLSHAWSLRATYRRRLEPKADAGSAGARRALAGSTTVSFDVQWLATIRARAGDSLHHGRDLACCMRPAAWPSAASEQRHAQPGHPRRADRSGFDEDRLRRRRRRRAPLFGRALDRARRGATTSTSGHRRHLPASTCPVGPYRGEILEQATDGSSSACRSKDF